MNDIPHQIGSLDAHKRAYYCTLCESTHCYGDIWLDHKEYRSKDVIYEDWETYKEKYEKIREELERREAEEDSQRKEDVNKVEMQLREELRELEEMEGELIDKDILFDDLGE